MPSDCKFVCDECAETGDSGERCRERGMRFAHRGYGLVWKTTKCQDDVPNVVFEPLPSTQTTISAPPAVEFALHESCEEESIATPLVFVNPAKMGSPALTPVSPETATFLQVPTLTSPTVTASV